ncbi:unnamed protein product [Peniophora sp. CBMAI 1063]|nr:unnamed protein product [Peniophora sp. CBMAI 1063]
MLGSMGTAIFSYNRVKTVKGIYELVRNLSGTVRVGGGAASSLGGLISISQSRDLLPMTVPVHETICYHPDGHGRIIAVSEQERSVRETVGEGLRRQPFQPVCVLLGLPVYQSPR